MRKLFLYTHPTSNFCTITSSYSARPWNAAQPKLWKSYSNPRRQFASAFGHQRYCLVPQNEKGSQYDLALTEKNLRLIRAFPVIKAPFVYEQHIRRFSFGKVSFEYISKIVSTFSKLLSAILAYILLSNKLKRTRRLFKTLCLKLRVKTYRRLHFTLRRMHMSRRMVFR